MTDGQPTDGETNSETLSQFVNNKFTSTFVGFGVDHNAYLLNKLSDFDNADYQFVNDMENTSLIYGETIHRYLYPSIQNVEIQVTGGTIYNWKKNTWETSLFESVITSEMKKIYHVKRNKDEKMEAKIFGFISSVPEGCDENEINTEYNLLYKVEEMPELVDDETFEEIENDLTKYLFRQKTQEILYMIKSKDKINNQDRKVMKMNIKNLFKLMRRYMKENDLMEDAFMKLLCDDLSVTYQTMDLTNGAMYALSRFTSQGRQQTYSATPKRTNKIIVKDVYESLEQEDYNNNLTPYLSLPLRLKRHQNTILSSKFKKSLDEIDKEYDEEESQQSEHTDINDYEYDEENDFEKIEYYTPSQETTTCYATKSSLLTMEEINSVE